MNLPARPGWAALAAVATLTLVACTGGGRTGATAQGRVEAGVARSAADLSRALDLTVPDGWTVQPDSVGDTGPSDLEKAVSDDGGDDARDVLTRDRFVRGYQRMWSRGNDEIISYVYQFADHAGAADYTTRLTGDTGGNSSGFSVPAIAGAVGVNGADPPFATSSVTFVKGPYSVQLVVNAASPDELQALASALAEEQFARLAI